MNDLQKELQDLKAKVAELKAKVAELEARVVAKPAVKKWEPKGGDFFVGAGGSVSMYDSRVFTKEFGMERETREQAQRAAKEMRRFNRLLALRDELCGGEVVDWSVRIKEKHYLYFSHDRNSWYISENIHCESIMPYFTTEKLAQKACDMLNSGEVEL